MVQRLTPTDCDETGSSVAAVLEMGKVPAAASRDCSDAASVVALIVVPFAAVVDEPTLAKGSRAQRSRTEDSAGNPEHTR